MFLPLKPGDTVIIHIDGSDRAFTVKNTATNCLSKLICVGSDNTAITIDLNFWRTLLETGRAIVRSKIEDGRTIWTLAVYSIGYVDKIKNSICFRKAERKDLFFVDVLKLQYTFKDFSGEYNKLLKCVKGEVYQPSVINLYCGNILIGSSFDCMPKLILGEMLNAKARHLDITDNIMYVQNEGFVELHLLSNPTLELRLKQFEGSFIGDRPGILATAKVARGKLIKDIKPSKLSISTEFATFKAKVTEQWV